jgi:hypothetical protein
MRRRVPLGRSGCAHRPHAVSSAVILGSERAYLQRTGSGRVGDGGRAVAGGPELRSQGLGAGALAALGRTKGLGAGHRLENLPPRASAVRGPPGPSWPRRYPTTSRADAGGVACSVCVAGAIWALEPLRRRAWCHLFEGGEPDSRLEHREHVAAQVCAVRSVCELQTPVKWGSALG